MGDMNHTFGLGRMVVFGAVTLFALLALAMAAAITNFTNSYFRGAYFIYCALGIATAILTIFTLPVMVFLSMKRKGAVTSMIVVELVWTGILWVLWLATGALIASGVWINNCSVYARYRSGYTAACMESQALAAFSFLNWIFLMAYFFTLLVLAIRLSSNGTTNAWTSDVTEVNYNATNANQTVVPPVTESKMDPALAGQYTGSTVGTPGTPIYGYPQQPITPIPQSVQHVQTPSYPQV